MDDVFIFNEQASDIEIQDAIDERFLKLNAITKCLWANHSSELQLDDTTIHDIVFCLNEFLEEIDFLKKIQVRKRFPNF